MIDLSAATELVEWMRANRVVHAKVGDVELSLEMFADEPSVALDEDALKRIADGAEPDEDDRRNVYEALGLPRLPRPMRRGS